MNCSRACLSSRWSIKFIVFHNDVTGNWPRQRIVRLVRSNSFRVVLLDLIRVRDDSWWGQLCEPIIYIMYDTRPCLVSFINKTPYSFIQVFNYLNNQNENKSLLYYFSIFKFFHLLKAVRLTSNWKMSNI